MFEALIFEWLEEFNSLSESEIRSYASEQVHNNEIVIALYTIFDEHVKYSQLIDPVCNQLFYFYRSGEEDLQRFALQFIPALVLLYLENVTHGDRQSYRSVETLLIGVYNLEIIDKSGQSKVFSFRIPSIAQASIYHEPTTLDPSFLTDSCLRRLEECNTKLVNWGPLPQVEFLNAQNRLRVMTALLFIYNRQLSKISGTSLEYLCKSTSRLVTQGFHASGTHVRLSVDSDNSYSTQLVPRIALSSQLLLELLNGIYYALFDRNTTHATQALDDIYNRACYESYIDVLLVANSIKNLLHISRSGITDGILNMNLMQHTPSSSVSVTKSMITNASFRTKKLPDDIPIQIDREEAETAGLGSITEEKEEEEGKGVLRNSVKGSKENAASSALAGVKNLPKTISGLGKKVKESKVGMKTSQPLEKEKNDSIKRTVEIEKDGVKYMKDENINKPNIEDSDYKNNIVTDKEKVSLVSDSLKTNDAIDGVTSSSNGKVDNYNEIMPHNAVHVSSV